MDIKELENYRLSDAVKFNDTLNPRLWGSDENLLPEVREKLLAIANDFREFLGVPDLRVQDITVSGSNAAYTYTPHSDIDLHLVVDLPEDAVYRELFDAKKYQYNTQHNIKIAGYDVELYVQPAGDTHHSQGIYSVKNGDWISVPQRRHPDVDDISVQSKYEDIGHRIEQAIESGDLAQIVAVAKKVKQMRQAGLDQTGEFGPENLAFKALRSNGTLDQMRAALQAAQDRQLSLDEEQRNKTKKKHHYGRVGGMWLPGYEYMTTAPEIANESQDRGQVRDTIKQFARSCFKQYGLKNPPKIRIQHNPDWTKRNGTFGRFDPDTNTIELAVTGRHMLDILRTLAHELTHAKQNEQGEMPDDAGRTGSPYEDAANAQAGRMMRHWAEQHPDQFKDVKLDEASGYIPANSREAQDPRYSMALTVDIKPGEVQRQAAKMGWKTDAAGRPPLLMAFQNQLASSKRATSLTERYHAPISQVPGSVEDDLGNQEATGPEFPPQWPEGTTKVDVGDLTDWYRLGMDISDMDDADPKDYNQGPPQTVIVFPSDEFEQPYLQQLKRLGLKTHDMDADQPGGEHMHEDDDELLSEGATDVLYHMTSTRSAANILADGVFKLASSVGTKAEEKYAPPDRPYFLSTSRSKAGDYSRSVGTSAVMFDLNGQWLAQRYQVKPIDYWDRAWLNNPERTSESEDRVFSKDPEISIACVTSVHALIKTADEWRSPYTRQVLLMAKQRGIPAFLYTDPKAWKLQDTRNSVSPQQASALLKGSVPVRTQYKPASSYLEPWLELIHKKAKSELSPKAEKLRYNLVYYGLRYPNEDNGLADDMNNSRKPDSPDYANVDKLIKFMRANRMAKPADLKNALAQKWDAINTKEQQSAKDQQPVAEDTGANIPPVLYHATYKQRLKSIQLKGLGAGSKRNWTDSKRGVVYLALDPDVAESYAETALDDLDADWDIVILKISTSGLDTNKFQLDRNVLDNEGDTLEYHGIIPPGNISLYKPGVTEDTVDEMALSTYKTMGDFDKPGPFTGADKKLVPHAKNIEKATKFFEQSPYDFRLFFSNIPGTGKYGEYGPMTPDQIRKIFGADAEEIIQGSEDAITVVYVGNRGEAKVMLTPWVMAHRLGHAIQAGARGTRTGHVWTAAEKHFFTTVNSTLAEHYGKVDRGPSSYLGRPKAEQANINLTPEYNALFNAIGTQRSSRSGQILRPYEFLYEIFAQYLGTGKITFNPLPANLTYGRKAFGNPSKFMNIKPEYRDEFSRKEAADRLAYDMEIMFDSVLAGSVGKILVM